MIHLVRAYRQKLKTTKPVRKSVPQWTESAIQRLQGCFACTDWDVFIEDGIDRSAEVVLDYIGFCQDLCIPKKRVTILGNDKPCFSSSLQRALCERDTAFRSGDVMAFKQAKYKFERAVRSAKRKYKQKLENGMLNCGDRDMWKQLQTIVPYKSKSKSTVSGKPSLAYSFMVTAVSY